MICGVQATISDYSAEKSSLSYLQENNGGFGLAEKESMERNKSIFTNSTFHRDKNQRQQSTSFEQEPKPQQQPNSRIDSP
jgi:hypothetical protein